jgi:hypothetical protein
MKTPSNSFKLIIKKNFSIEEEKILNEYNRHVCIANSNGKPLYLIPYNIETNELLDLKDLNTKDSFKELIDGMSIIEVMDLINSLVESIGSQSNDKDIETEIINVLEKQSTIATVVKKSYLAPVWEILLMRSKASKVTMNRRILAEFSSMMKAIEVENEKTFLIDPTQFEESLNFNQGLAFDFNEKDCKIDQLNLGPESTKTPELLIAVIPLYPLGTISSMLTLVAVLGPSLCKVSVKVTISPTFGVVLSIVFNKLRLATFGIIVTSD